MATNSSTWPDLPRDILSSIADRLDKKIGVLRLRSICRSWRSALSSFHSDINFPLKLPSPLSPSSNFLSLFQRTVYLLSSPQNPSNGGFFLIKLEVRENCPNTFTLLDPLSTLITFPQPNSSINLLDYRISVVSESYYVYSDLDSEIKKVVVARNFFKNGDFVVLGLEFSGGLLIWRFGDDVWTEIEAFGRCFDDIISYNGKFYATADKKGRLVMIDSRLQPIDLVPKLMYGDGTCTHLVECDGDLWLVDEVFHDIQTRFGVFKLDEKGRFWDYELNLKDCVFFIGDDANFSLLRSEYNGCIRNVIYSKKVYFGDEGIIGFTKVFDMKTDISSVMEDSESYVELYNPPSSWFNPH
ncbi:hypothetical protein BVRB_009410 [Beta vulgaris subsp. vulgaris]|uniref:F-box domain-containing protein n=1 Tax=Beta vulgaris subsp. vulgaris TaxID=3555 RepID=A0A0J8B2G8_BETVV|nr:F-box protein SKIP23 [Beta vulgaris subsp. vulgaris]XP_019103173.1 F-box protein SKIP23 [Beta vulgaris subsp. vulgaris]KMS95314.1 hypothetical protein BVRB_009410 [Beta vulgaris subsp. vulgaris]